MNELNTHSEISIVGINFVDREFKGFYFTWTYTQYTFSAKGFPSSVTLHNLQIFNLSKYKKTKHNPCILSCLLYNLVENSQRSCRILYYLRYLNVQQTMHRIYHIIFTEQLFLSYCVFTQDNVWEIRVFLFIILFKHSSECNSA